MKGRLIQIPIYSASAITKWRDYYFVAGDDSPYILVLNKDFEEVQRIILPGCKDYDQSKRIPKMQKFDIEAMCLAWWKTDALVVFGSGSLPNREVAFAIDLQAFPEMYKISDRSEWYKKVLMISSLAVGAANPDDFETLNIEGATSIRKAGYASELILADRRSNSLLRMDENGNVLPLVVALPRKNGFRGGLTDIYYEPKRDSLFFTATFEQTDSVIDDAPVSESWLCCIDRFKFNYPFTYPSPAKTEVLHEGAAYGVIKKTKNRKNEGVCVTMVGDKLDYVIVSDSDKDEHSWLYATSKSLADWNSDDRMPHPPLWKPDDPEDFAAGGALEQLAAQIETVKTSLQYLEGDARLKMEEYLHALEKKRHDWLADYGEKIGGAKKDWLAGLEHITDEDLLRLPLSKVFPEPDYAAMYKNGEISEDGAILMRFMYQELPPKPRNKHRIMDWINTVKEAIGSVREIVVSGKYKPGAERENSLLDDIAEKAGPKSSLFRKASIFQQMMREFNFPKENVNLRGYTIEPSYYNNEYWVMRVGSRRGFSEPTFDKAMQKLREILGAKATESRSVALRLFRGKDEFYIGVVSNRTVIPLKRGFKTIAEADAYRKEHSEELMAEWIAERKKMKEIPDERRLTNRPRKGQNWRGGRNISSEEFAQTFGFRGVEFGNWVNSTERQMHVNEAYDALRDLAAVLGISPQGLSLNGELALAFGARGSGKANAHYEPGRRVINLTKTRGAGSLAHEWWHSLDNYFARKRGRSARVIEDLYVTSSVNWTGDGARVEVIEGKYEYGKGWRRGGFKGVVKALEGTDLSDRSYELDKGKSKPYWSTMVEMSARAFENYIVNALAAKGEVNDYLANFKTFDEWINSFGEDKEQRDRLRNSYPYPLQEESPAIDAAYQDLFETIQENENGELYASGGILKAPISITVPTAQEMWDEMREAYRSNVASMFTHGKLGFEVSAADLAKLPFDKLPADMRKLIEEKYVENEWGRFGKLERLITLITSAIQGDAPVYRGNVISAKIKYNDGRPEKAERFAMSANAPIRMDARSRTRGRYLTEIFKEDIDFVEGIQFFEETERLYASGGPLITKEYRIPEPKPIVIHEDATIAELPLVTPKQKPRVSTQQIADGQHSKFLGEISIFYNRNFQRSSFAIRDSPDVTKYLREIKLDRKSQTVALYINRRNEILGYSKLAATVDPVQMWDHVAANCIKSLALGLVIVDYVADRQVFEAAVAETSFQQKRLDYAFNVTLLDRMAVFNLDTDEYFSYVDQGRLEKGGKLYSIPEPKPFLLNDDLEVFNKDITPRTPEISDHLFGELGVAYFKNAPKVDVRIKNSADADAFLRSISDKQTQDLQESFYAVYLKGNKVIAWHSPFRGGVTATVAEPSIILSAALRVKADGLIFSHNHPSGNPTPSRADVELTQKMTNAAGIIGINVIDHLIITHNSGYYSLRDESPASFNQDLRAYRLAKGGAGDVAKEVEDKVDKKKVVKKNPQYYKNIAYLAKIGLGHQFSQEDVDHANKFYRLAQGSSPEKSPGYDITTERRYKILGFNDDECTCHICGKEDLKGTYAIEDLSTGDIIRAGSVCGARMAGWTVKELIQKYSAAYKANLEAAQKEFRESAEYLEYTEGLDFLNKESDDLERELMRHPDENERKALMATERTRESRMAYLKPLSSAMARKAEEIRSRFNLPDKIYLG